LSRSSYSTRIAWNKQREGNSSYNEKKLVNCTDPRRFGTSLQGNLRVKWRNRLGNYRILAKIEDDRIIFVILEIGHGRSVDREK